eukprot:2295108-Pleurochrysis_carterae.AAC.1
MQPAAPTSSIVRARLLLHGPKSPTRQGSGAQRVAGCICTKGRRRGEKEGKASAPVALFMRLAPFRKGRVTRAAPPAPPP